MRKIAECALAVACGLIMYFSIPEFGGIRAASASGLTMRPVHMKLEFELGEEKPCHLGMEIEWGWRCWWGMATSWEDAAGMQEAADRQWLKDELAKLGVDVIEWFPCWPPEAMEWYPSDFPEPHLWAGWESGCPAN